MDEIGSVNIFFSEGVGANEIIVEKETAGEEMGCDSFGYVKLDSIDPGQQLVKQSTERLGVEEVMVQKLGYYPRTWYSNMDDLALIDLMVDMVVGRTFKGKSGMIGKDGENDNELPRIAFLRIRGRKAFDAPRQWFTNLMGAIGQKLQAHWQPTDNPSFR